MSRFDIEGDEYAELIDEDEADCAARCSITVLFYAGFNDRIDFIGDLVSFFIRMGFPSICTNGFQGNDIRSKARVFFSRSRIHHAVGYDGNGKGFYMVVNFPIGETNAVMETRLAAIRKRAGMDVVVIWHIQSCHIL